MAAPRFRFPATGVEEEEERPKPKPRRSKKTPVQKRQPQRGLGVAQLERLRLQERWKKIAEMGHLPEHDAGIPVYDCAGLPMSSVGYALPSGDAYFFQRQRVRGVANPVGATGAVQYVHPLLHDQYRNLQVELGVGGGGQLALPVLVPELSSNQSLQCFSEDCDICLKAILTILVFAKKRALGIGERLGFAERFHKSTRPDPFLSSQIKAKKVAEPKEYEFFPSARDTAEETDCGGPAPRRDEHFYSLVGKPRSVDLSLKLSL